MSVIATATCPTLSPEIRNRAIRRRIQILAKDNKSTDPGVTDKEDTFDVSITYQKKVTIFPVILEPSISSPKNTSDDSELAYFLDGVYLLESKGQSRKAVDYIVNYVDDLLINSRFEDCDSLLWQANVTRLSAESIVAFLGITLAAKNKLHARAVFHACGHARFVDKLGKDRATYLSTKYK